MNHSVLTNLKVFYIKRAHHYSVIYKSYCIEKYRLGFTSIVISDIVCDYGVRGYAEE